MDEYWLSNANRESLETPFVTTRIIELRLMDRPLAVSAQPGSEARLENAALYLDTRLQSVRQQLPTVSSERIALITALNLAAELLDIRDKHHRSHPVLDNESARHLQKLATQMAQTGGVLEEVLRKLVPTDADETTNTDETPRKAEKKVRSA